MNRRFVLAVLAAIALATGTGCRPAPLPGDVTFAWSFYGLSCAQDPNIQWVRITIPGEALENNGYYPCNSNGYDGIVLHDFAPGTYSFVIDAIDYSGFLSYSGGGTFHVNGSILVQVDLAPTGQGLSWAHLTWSLPPASAATPPCDAHGIARVQAQIDDQSPVDFTCAEGLADPGAKSPLMDPGMHRIVLRALAEDGAVVYSAQSTFTTYAGKPVSAGFSLQLPASSP